MANKEEHKKAPDAASREKQEKIPWEKPTFLIVNDAADVTESAAGRGGDYSGFS